MKKLQLFKLALMLVLVINITETQAQGTDEIKSKIIKINKEMQQAMLSGTSSAILSHYAADAISMPNYGKMVKGIDAIKKSNEEMMASGMKITSFETNTSMVNACEKMVTEVGTYKMSYTAAGAANSMEDAGKYLTVWEKQGDGSLKIKLEIWNTDTYPMSGN